MVRTPPAAYPDWRTKKTPDGIHVYYCSEDLPASRLLSTRTFRADFADYGRIDSSGVVMFTIGL